MSGLVKEEFTERYEEELRNWIALLEGLEESTVTGALIKSSPMLQSLILNRSPRLKRSMTMAVL